MICYCTLCKQERRRHYWRRVLFTLGAALVVASAVLLSAGCGTVAPKVIAAESASFDGNEQTSGIIAVSPAGVVVTDHFRDRYNALIATYGRDFVVPLHVDEGLLPIEPNRWLIDRGNFTKFLEMNAWRRAGLAPKAPKP